MNAPTAADVALNHRRFNGGGLTNWRAMRAATRGAIDLGTLEHRKLVHRWRNQWDAAFHMAATATRPGR